jgi:hypothetical protein
MVNVWGTSGDRGGTQAAAYPIGMMIAAQFADRMHWGILLAPENGLKLYYPMAYSMALGAVLYGHAP